jgi:hypothetical protein
MGTMNRSLPNPAAGPATGDDVVELVETALT